MRYKITITDNENGAINFERTCDAIFAVIGDTEKSATIQMVDGTDALLVKVLEKANVESSNAMLPFNYLTYCKERNKDVKKFVNDNDLSTLIDVVKEKK